MPTPIGVHLCHISGRKTSPVATHCRGTHGFPADIPSEFRETPVFGHFSRVTRVTKTEIRLSRLSYIVRSLTIVESHVRHRSVTFTKMAEFIGKTYSSMFCEPPSDAY